MSRPADHLAKFRPVNLTLDASPLPADVLEALPLIKGAMDAITDVFLCQQDEALPELWARVMGGDDEELKALFRFCKGPWDQLDDHASVMEGVEARRPGCAFYPPDLTRRELEAFAGKLEPEAKEALLRDTTLVRREGDALAWAPYHEAYRDLLLPARDKLVRASQIVEHPGLKAYLELRGESLVDGRYRDADAAWVRLQDAPIELVLGPYEVYADALMGLKATYEGMLFVNDTERAARLATIAQNLGHLAAAFPVPGGAKAAVGGVAPIVVAHQIHASGDASAGLMASAFNLPNDPWVRGHVGWKQVMIHNVMKAKFESCGLPIAADIVEGGGRADFEAYFYFVLLHEVSHGLGPAYRADGTSVSKSLGKHYTAIEEAKADTGSIYLLHRLAGRHGLPGFDVEQLLDAYLPGLFRSMRFGLQEAHGAANIIQFNWFQERGVIRQTASGRYATDATRFAGAMSDLLATLTGLQATATVDQAGAFVERYAKPGSDLVRAIASLAHIPIDIRATFPAV